MIRKFFTQQLLKRAYHTSIPKVQREPGIDYYTYNTPNTWKVDLLLKELDLQYNKFKIDILKGEQFKPEFLKISPNNKIPALVDRRRKESITLFESGAIMLYLAEVENKFIPNNIKGRFEVIKWLNWHVGGQAPMQAQFGHFTSAWANKLPYAPEKIPYAIERYTAEVKRLYSVLDRQLETNKYVAGDEYSIADMAIWSWAIGLERSVIDHTQYKNVERWKQDLLNDRKKVKELYQNIMKE